MSTSGRDTRDRLESWKEIAAFLNRGVRTVQRWERTEGLPVHRHMHDRLGTVFAYKDELEAWWASRSSRLEEPSPLQPPLSPAPVRWRAATALATVAVVVPLAAWRITSDRADELSLAAAVPFTAAPGYEQQPSFSPDGRRVVYIAGDLDKKNFDLYIQALDRGEPERFTSDPTYETNPAWSPDGGSIAYIRSEAGKPGDLMVQPASRGPARKVDTVRFHGQPSPGIAWTHNAEWLFVSDKPQSNQPAGIFRVHRATGERHRLTSCDRDCIADGALDLSSDGRDLLFLRYGRGGLGDVWILPVNERGEASTWPRRLTHLNGLLGPPVWLPGGREIAIPLLSDFTWTWQRISRSGVSLGPLDAFAQLRPRLAFSPDGRYIVAPDYQEDQNLRRVDLSTGEEQEVAASTRVDTNANISPDGRHIIFPSNRRGNIDLWMTDADGSNPVHLFGVPGKSSGTPRWSPDGLHIAFDIADSASSDIYVMNANGTQVHKLTDHPARDWVPSWSRDGRWIYFGSDRDGDPQIYKVLARGGGTAMRVTQNGGFAASESADGSSLFVIKSTQKSFSPRTAPVMWRLDVASGLEEPLPGIQTDWSRYVIRPEGIYYIASGDDERDLLRLYDFKSRSIRDVRRLQRPSSMGFSLAPDGKWAVYTSVMYSGVDLMLHRIHRR